MRPDVSGRDKQIKLDAMAKGGGKISGDMSKSLQAASQAATMTIASSADCSRCTPITFVILLITTTPSELARQKSCGCGHIIRRSGAYPSF